MFAVATVDGKLKPPGGLICSWYVPGAASGKRYIPAGRLIVVPQAANEVPLITLDGYGVTPSSQNTCAGAPVATLISVTVAPLTGLPLVESNTSPNGSTRAPSLVESLPSTMSV